MKNKIALASLAMDLRRVALGYHRGSVAMADRFYREALLRKREIDMADIKPYLRRLLESLDGLSSKDTDRRAEDMLTYSVLFQNAAMRMQAEDGAI